MFKKILRLIFFVLAFSANIINAATYYISTTGSDSTGNGSLATPWKTIQKGEDNAANGDTIIVLDGQYDEAVSVATPGITFISSNLWGAQTKVFRVQATNTTIHGFNLNRFSDANRPWGQSWGGNIRVEIASHNMSAISNLFGPGLYVATTNFSFNATSNAIVNQTIDFGSYGFTNSSHIYIGSSGLDGLWPSNHNTAWMVASISADGHAMYVTNNAGDAFITDTGSNYWAAIHAGNGSEAMYGIYGVQTGGAYATNWTVIGNTFSNMFGAPMYLYVDGAIIRSNYIYAHGGYRIAAFQGKNIYFENNLCKDFRSAARYTQQEIQNLVHPEGADWFDYASSELSAFSANSSNIFIRSNWFQNIDNQLGLADPFTNSYGIYIHSNVFVGVTEHFSGGRSGIEFVGNTFYRVAYEFGESTPLAVGSSPPSVYDMIIMKN